jgi:drug/metabolite transporter (DMT)-like permease
MLPPTPGQDGVMRGIGLKVVSVALFLLMASLLKGSPGVPPGEMVFFRSFFGIVPIIIFLAWRGELVEGFKTTRPLGHFWRGMFAVGGMGLGFYALTKLPLPEAIAIGYAMPLLIVVFGAVFLKETVRAYRWSAVVAGMVGVGIIIWPRLTVFSGAGGEINELTLGVLACLGSCVFAAFATMQVRKLVSTERSATIALYFSITCSIAGALTVPFGWAWPTPTLWVTLIGSGIAGGIGQILLTEAYRHADVSVIAPFEYVSLVLSLIIGYLVFSDVPTPTMIFGAVIVVMAGLFIIYREHVLGLDRRRTREVTPPPPG